MGVMVMRPLLMQVRGVKATPPDQPQQILMLVEVAVKVTPPNLLMLVEVVVGVVKIKP